MTVLIRRAGAAFSQGILDDVTTATHAYSEKLLKVSQAGTNLVRMRANDGGSTEADFSMALADADQYGSGSMKTGGQTRADWLTSLGATDAFRRTFYDKVGAQNLAQTTAANQAKELAAGTATLDGTNDNAETGALTFSGDFEADVFCYLHPNVAAANCPWFFGAPLTALGAFGLFHGLRGANVLSVEFAGGHPAIFQTCTQAAHRVRVRKTAGAINTTTRLWVDGSEHTIQGGSSTSTPGLINAQPLRWGGDSLFTFWTNILGTFICRLGGTFSDGDAALIETWFANAYGL